MVLERTLVWKVLCGTRYGALKNHVSTVLWGTFIGSLKNSLRNSFFKEQLVCFSRPSITYQAVVQDSPSACELKAGGGFVEVTWGPAALRTTASLIPAVLTVLVSVTDQKAADTLTCTGFHSSDLFLPRYEIHNVGRVGGRGNPFYVNVKSVKNVFPKEPYFEGSLRHFYRFFEELFKEMVL